MQCEDIQGFLFDYISGELDTARSNLVREHLKKCPNCQAAAAEIREAMNVLREGSEALGVPKRLSEDHRKHLMWAVTHPIMDWMDRHHIITSLILAVIVTLYILFVLWHFDIGKREDAKVYEISIMKSDVTNAPLNKIEEIKPPDITNLDEPRPEPRLIDPRSEP